MPSIFLLRLHGFRRQNNDRKPRVTPRVMTKWKIDINLDIVTVLQQCHLLEAAQPEVFV